MRLEMEPPAHRIRNRLRLVVIIEAGQVAPAGVTSDFDQPRPEHDPKRQPAEQPDDQFRRRLARKRTSVNQRAKKNGQKTSLQKLDLPAIGIPVLTDVYE